MEYVLIVLCLMGSAFFSGTEIAYTSLSKLKLKKDRENPRGIRKLVLFIYDHFDNALSTILIGNNLVNIALTAVATMLLVMMKISMRSAPMARHMRLMLSSTRCTSAPQTSISSPISIAQVSNSFMRASKGSCCRHYNTFFATLQEVSQK